MNFYLLLGLSPDATPEELKQAYHKLAKLYHPDKNRSPDATMKMAEINLAYETLCDSQKRAEYNIKNGIEMIAEPVEDEEEELEQEMQERPWGKCARCNFVNNSGMFICSFCGYVYKPETRSETEIEYSDNKDEISYKDIANDFANNEAKEHEDDAVSEIIRCPRCDEINRYSSGYCWQCNLEFEEAA